MSTVFTLIRELGKIPELKLNNFFSRAANVQTQGNYQDLKVLSLWFAQKTTWEHLISHWHGKKN